jgi:hypothetical protein
MRRSLNCISGWVFSTWGVFLCVACGTGSGSSGDATQSMAASGATHSAGAGGGSSGCHTAADCPMTAPPAPSGVTQCLSPDQVAPPTVCGAAQWCGQCSCPPMPPVPMGNGISCETNQDCPAPLAGASTASICAMKQCVQCGTSTDCPTDAPQCSSVQGGFAPSFRLCVACLTDPDCPTAKPHCSLAGGYGTCVACTFSNDCAEGVCADGAYVPGCGADKPCSNPLTECTAKQRCEALSCAASTSCPPNTACMTGHCQRRGCTTDAACDQGACVNSICYETKGTCFTQMFAP